MRRLIDALLSTDPVQRVRLSQAALAMLMLAIGVIGMHYFVWAGYARATPVWWWTLFSLGGMVVFFALIRGGWARRLKEPSLTVPQMVYALACSAVAYALLGAGRGGVFPIVLVILMFGMFVVSPAQMRWLSAYAVALFGATMAFMAWREPAVYAPRTEAGHFLMIATMVPVASVLAGRLSRMRERLRAQRSELAQALARIREQATRDELTALANRRHMEEQLAQEHQRCIRSGQTFCIAMFNIDNFGAVNAAHGVDFGDTVLRAVAQEATRHVRLSDSLARWGGDVFVLMMSDTRAALARGGLERLRQRVGALRMLQGATVVEVTLSCGLAEHHAGETLGQTLARAERAMGDARSQGRDRVVVAA
jgi:diguanylate cyclase (GGDEF)-like protein